MLGRSSGVELSRRVTAYYLMFGLAAVVWLGVGVVVVAKSVLETRAETGCLGRLGEAAGAIRSAALHDRADLAVLVKHFQSRWGWDYCALVSPDGYFLAHSSPSRVGDRHKVPTGQVAHWGDVQRTRYINHDSRVLREYQTSIRQGDQTRATLVMGVPDVGVWGTVLAAAEYAPAALLCPMLVMGIGAVVLRRIVRPASAIEGQLQRVAASPSFSENDLDRVNLPTPAGVGWNRIVEFFANNCRHNDLESHLSRVVDGYREQKAERILNSLSDATAVTDESGQITFANKALTGLLGMGTSDDSLCGKTMEECLALESAGESAAQLLDAKLRGRTVVVQMNRPGDVPEGILRVARSPQSGAPGEPSAGHVWSVRDITQQKLADQMRDQFVNAATHELRTPLANIKAYAEMLALSEVDDPEQQKEFCNIINEEVTRLARFVDDLLQLSRMEVGATSLNRQVTDMERLLRETIEKVRPQIQQKRIDLDVQLPGKLPELFVDKDKLTVALFNLLGNAAKYTPEAGSVRLHVEISDERMQIDVEDTGIGISAEELPKIFDKFYRSSDSRVNDQTGSGLGLSLAHEIIRLHGGKLTVHSELNKGSIFTATLPTSREGV